MFFKVALVVLSVVSLAHCAPGYLGGYHALPAATSYSSRIDIHGPEYVKTYAAPVIAKTIIPSYHEPLLGYGGYGYGHGLEHGYGYGQGIGFGQGLGYGHGLEHGLGHGIGHYY